MIFAYSEEDAIKMENKLLNLINIGWLYVTRIINKGFRHYRWNTNIMTVASSPKVAKTSGYFACSIRLATAGPLPGKTLNTHS